RQPGQRRHADHAAAAGDDGGPGLGADPGDRRRRADRHPLGVTTVLVVRPGRDHVRVHRLFAPDLLHRAPVHSAVQHPPRLAALHLPGGYQHDGMAMVLGAPRGRPPLRLARPADQLPLVAARGASEAVVAVSAASDATASLWLEAGRRFRRHHLAMVGTVILVAMVVAVLAGPLVWRQPINEIDFKAKLKSPSWSHPLGTDDLGQDLLARMLYGGRISLAVGIAAMLIAISIGTTIGATSGFVGGTIDNTLMRITDMFLSLPGLPLLLLVIYLFRDTLKA